MEMNNNPSIVSGEFVTFKHVKTRKAFIIEIEFPEEIGQQVLATLGMPIGGESKTVAVALLQDKVLPDNNKKTELMKPSQKAALLCKQRAFQEFCVAGTSEVPSEECAKQKLYSICEIKSRAELDLCNNPLFDYFITNYEQRQLQERYSDNLSRI